jgi:hypothetical protein
VTRVRVAHRSYGVDDMASAGVLGALSAQWSPGQSHLSRGLEDLADEFCKCRVNLLTKKNVRFNINYEKDNFTLWNYCRLFNFKLIKFKDEKKSSSIGLIN